MKTCTIINEQVHTFYIAHVHTTHGQLFNKRFMFLVSYTLLPLYVSHISHDTLVKRSHSTVTATEYVASTTKTLHCTSIHLSLFRPTEWHFRRTAYPHTQQTDRETPTVYFLANTQFSAQETTAGSDRASSHACLRYFCGGRARLPVLRSIRTYHKYTV